MRQILQVLIATAMFSTLIVGAAHSGEIITEGRAVLNQLPKALRTRITIQEHATSAEDAMAKIAANQRALHEYLLALGANPRSILFGEISVVDHKGKLTSKLVSAPQKRFRGFGSTAASEGQEVVTLSVGGAAEWELTARSQQNLVVEFHAVRKRIVAAYDQVKKENPNLASSFSPPSFELVGRIDDRQKMELLQAAFDNAKMRAAQLADVANVELGPLVKLNTKNGPRPVTDHRSTTADYRQDNLWEATTDRPAPVTFRIDVSTIFSINHSLAASGQPAGPSHSVSGRVREGLCG